MKVNLTLLVLSLTLGSSSLAGVDKLDNPSFGGGTADKPEKVRPEVAVDKPPSHAEAIASHAELTEARIKQVQEASAAMGKAPDPAAIEGIKARHEACKGSMSKCN